MNQINARAQKAIDQCQASYIQRQRQPIDEGFAPEFVAAVALKRFTAEGFATCSWGEYTADVGGSSIGTAVINWGLNRDRYVIKGVLAGIILIIGCLTAKRLANS
jgi:hypothetical protein